MNPLPVVRKFGKPVDELLGDRLPIAVCRRAADTGFEFRDGREYARSYAGTVSRLRTLCSV